jgi:hypothetical protein
MLNDKPLQAASSTATGFPQAGKQIEDIRRTIIELHNRRGVIFDHETRSVRGRINHVKWLNPLQGITLVRLADRLLPEPSASGRAHFDEPARECKSYSRDHSR